MRSKATQVGATLVAAAAVSTAFALTALGSPRNQKHRAVPVRYAVGKLALRSAGPGTPPGLLLRSIVGRYGGHAVATAGVGVGGPPADWRPSEGGSAAPAPQGLWVYASVPVKGLGAPAVRPVWEANLVVAALRDEVHAAGGSPEVIGSQVSGELPSSLVVPNIGGGVGDVVFGQRFAAAAPTVAAGIRSRATRLGLRVLTVDVLKPLQAAPAVVATTNDPAGFVDAADRNVNAVFGGVAVYEGEYLEVRAASGSPVFIQASTFRTGVGQRWIRPDLDPRQAPAAPASVDPTVG
jgi:hypothetical protein